MKHSAHNFNFQLLSGEQLYLKDLTGKVFMVINTASTCGFNYQFKQLDKLLNHFSPEDFCIIAVPSNDFFSQEPLDDDQLFEYYQKYSHYQNLYITKTVEIIGFKAHPFYTWTRHTNPISGKPWWNYHKLIFNKKGALANWFSSLTTPKDIRIFNSIQGMIFKD